PTCTGVRRLGSVGPPRPAPPPKPPRPRPALGLLGSYCAFTCSSSRRLAGGAKFTGIPAALPSSTTLPFTLDWLALTHSSISALVGPSRAAAPPRPPPPRAPRPPAAAVSALAAGGGGGGPCGGTSCIA